jgi:RNA polymerase sigma-70 factor (ECF subfamily)
MHATPASLLELLRHPNEVCAWERFIELYSPLLYHWGKRLGLQDSDAADLVQDVFVLLLRKLPGFDYNPSKSFHAWLKTVFLNQYRFHQRTRVPIPREDAGDDLAAAELATFDDPEYQQYLIRQAFALIEREFTVQQRSAFRAYVLDEQPPEEVARKHGISPGTVYGIKSKILSRLRQELRELLDGAD